MDPPCITLNFSVKVDPSCRLLVNNFLAIWYLCRLTRQHKLCWFDFVGDIKGLNFLPFRFNVPDQALPFLVMSSFWYFIRSWALFLFWCHRYVIVSSFWFLSAAWPLCRFQWSKKYHPGIFWIASSKKFMIHINCILQAALTRWVLCCSDWGSLFSALVRYCHFGWIILLRSDYMVMFRICDLIVVHMFF